MTVPAPNPGAYCPETGGDALPRHIAIIMDGNGRWAKARGMPRSAGHERGVEALRRTVDAAGELGIKYLTVFSFSTENWRRPVDEVNVLFGLLRSYVRRDLARLAERGVRVRIIGDRTTVPDDIAELIEKAERDTKDNSHAFLTIAFNYGARDELVRAMRRVADRVAAGELAPDDIDEKQIEQALDTYGLPDPDLVIRTSGEYRISNFLLWQVAYSELLMLDVLWPDFEKEHLVKAIDEFCGRERRFGTVGSKAR
ncbi:MAG: isoprenyl transferase [Pseudomonadota bacterium]